MARLAQSSLAARRREAIMLWEQIAEEATARLVLMFNTTPKWPDGRPVPLLYLKR